MYTLDQNYYKIVGSINLTYLHTRSQPTLYTWKKISKDVSAYKKTAADVTSEDEKIYESSFI